MECSTTELPQQIVPANWSGQSGSCLLGIARKSLAGLGPVVARPKGQADWQDWGLLPQAWGPVQLAAWDLGS